MTITDIFKLFKINKIYYYVFIGLALLFLLIETFTSINIPFFYVSEENAGVFIMTLVALGVLAYKGDLSNVKVQDQANENALAAIAIALNMKLEDLKNQIELIKQLEPKT